MATNLAIDENLLAEAQRLGGFRTKKLTVNEALKSSLIATNKKKLLNYLGKLISILITTIKTVVLAK